VSPPFDDWSLVYIIPSTILSELKALAFGDSQDTTTSLPKIDLTSLIKDADGEEVIVIGATRTTEGKGKLDPNGSKTLVWSVKDGLVENDDFMFISEEGWKNIVEWCAEPD
jgi:ubiquitin carboxyl-terminal hydrolase 4/11/15